MATCTKCGQPTSILRKDIFSGICPACSRGITPVNLGCSTLILIAVIVAVFSRVGREDLESEVSRLRSTVQELKEGIDSQTNEIKQLRAAIEKLRPDGDPQNE